MQKKLGYIIGGLSLIFSIILVSLTFVRFSSPKNIYCEWMNNVDDEKYINEILIPGTHDSGAAHSLFDLAGKCQDTSILEQLNLGARFLDVRLKNIEDSFYVYHGYINQELIFQSVLDDVYSFLDTYPSETIIMSIKEEQDAKNNTLSFDALLQKYINNNPTYWYLENSLPTLKTVRDKIVLFSRYIDASISIDAYDGWLDSTTFDMNNGVSLHVQDNYRLANNDVKYADIVACLDYGVLNQTEWTINFCSGYLDTKVLGISLANAMTTAGYINDKVTDYILDNNSKNYVGVLLFDFYNQDIAEAIIK